MQLKSGAPLRCSGLRRALGAAAAGLLVGSPGLAQEPEAEPTTNLDAGVLYYHENDGRVQAIEPELNISQKVGDDGILSVGLVADSLTGATPLGAVPSTLPQTFVRPYKVVPLGTAVTVTTASGGSSVVIIPPATGAKSQTLAASTIVPANTYPVDHSFRDTRYAGNIGWEQAVTSNFKVNAGLAYSKEHDWRSESASLGVAQDFNGHNTTLNAGVNYESDLSFPIGGTPVPLTAMNGNWKGPHAGRHEWDAVIGITQVMSRRWLSTLSYSYASSQGYQNDPYKLVSVVDPSTGQPTGQLYENRPSARRKQSIFLENKVHLSKDTVDLSLRGYTDDWGIRSVTADLRYRYQLTEGYYLEPHARYYQQSAADFFHYFLVADQAIPQYGSADTRLATFHAMTYGLKFGMPLNEGSEFNVRFEYYDQHGNGSPSNAIGQLRQQNLFPDLQALTVLFGYSFAF